MRKQTKSQAILIAVALFIAVGAVVAEKVTKRSETIFTAANAGAPCTNELNDYTITAAGSVGEQRFASVASTLLACPLTIVTTKD